MTWDPVSSPVAMLHREAAGGHIGALADKWHTRPSDVVVAVVQIGYNNEAAGDVLVGNGILRDQPFLHALLAFGQT